MKRHSILLTAADLRRLGNLIGAEWLYVAGETLGPDLNSPVDVIVGTTSDSVRVVSEAVEADFEGDEIMTYSALAATEETGGLDLAKQRGNVYLQHQHEPITDVLVLRESITAFEGDQVEWEYTTDIGIIFVLSNGAVAIAKGSHHTEMLVVRMARTVEALDIPDRSIEWEDDLETRYVARRQVLSLRDLGET